MNKIIFVHSSKSFQIMNKRKRDFKITNSKKFKKNSKKIQKKVKKNLWIVDHLKANVNHLDDWVVSFHTLNICFNPKEIGIGITIYLSLLLNLNL